eukprot:scaffold18372_cov64-Cyclotella_meneghiniana.AAC.2
MNASRSHKRGRRRSAPALHSKRGKSAPLCQIQWPTVCDNEFINTYPVPSDIIHVWERCFTFRLKYLFSPDPLDIARLWVVRVVLEMEKNLQSDAHATVYSTKTDRPNVLSRRCECGCYCALMDMGRLEYVKKLNVDSHG